MFSTKTNGFLAGAVIAIIAAGFAYRAANEPMDFRVYHYGARGVFDGSRPVYGPESGLGWPMHYRYPPLFLLVFAPFAMLPLGAAAAIWTGLKAGMMAWVVKRISEFGFRNSDLGTRNPNSEIRIRKSRHTGWFPFLFITPYLIEELRYGNAQFFVFALTAAALLTARTRPILSAASLAFAISLKVWPLFFVPYLAARRDWKVVNYALAFVVVLALLPSLYFGLEGNLDLLAQWFRQESQTQLSESEIWFPNQSLRGVLMRYLTVIDYSKVPDSNYPLVNVASLNPTSVRLLWMVLAAVAYAGLLVMAHRSRNDDDGWVEHGIAFGMLAILQPFTQKYVLCVLLWPAIVAGALLTKTRLRILLYIATVLVLIQPLTPGAAAQRLFQVLGLDFVAALLLIGPVALLQARMRSGRIL